MPCTIQIPWLSYEFSWKMYIIFQKTAFFGQLRVRPQQVTLSLSSFFDPLCLVIKKYKNPLQNKLCCLQTIDQALLFHINAPHCGYRGSDVWMFCASVQFPLGVFWKPPELPCRQEFWVPADSSPSALRSPGGLFWHFVQWIANNVRREREKNWGQVFRHKAMLPIYITYPYFNFTLHSNEFKSHN